MVPQPITPDVYACLHRQAGRSQFLPVGGLLTGGRSQGCCRGDFPPVCISEKNERWLDVCG